MNESDSNKTPRNIAEEFAALVGLDALDGPDAGAMEHCNDCPFGKAAMAAYGYDDVVATMAAAEFPPMEPPADLEAKIMGKIDEYEKSKAPQGGYFFMNADEGDWTPLPGGKVRIKVLSDIEASGHTTVLLDVAPGGVIFPHAHKGMEEVFLITGDLETEGRTMGPGDYLRAAPGTKHQKAVSQNGCRAIIVTAHDNHPRKAIGIYDGLRRSLKALKGGSKESKN